MLDSVTSGGATLNDSFIHAQVPQSPLGGVGQSGMGSYHGYYSFKAFSHQRTVAQTPDWADFTLRVRYMPYSFKELDRFHLLNDRKPNFDRNGKPVKGLMYLLGLVFSLGSKSSKGALLRWAVLIAATAALVLKKGAVGMWMAKLPRVGSA